MELPARVYAQIDLDAICQNIQTAMQKVGADTKVMAIIKTDAYGHGAVPVARALKRIGTYAFGVATAEEAVQLRQNGIDNPILVLGFVFPADFDLMLEHDIWHTVFQYDTAKAYAARAAELGKTARVHIKVDTGMGRIGLQPDTDGVETVRLAAAT